MEKKLSFKEKIDIILSLKGLTVKDLEREWGKSSTLYKAIENPNGLSRRLTKEFLLKFHVKPSWWENPMGTDEAAVFEQNHTPAIKKDEVDVSEERKLIATLEQTVAIIERDNDNLWKQNATLIALVEKLSLTRANEN